MSNINKNALKKIIKKGAKVSLCAVLAGGLAAGSFQGVSYLTNVQEVSAATEDVKLTKMKSEKKSETKADDSGYVKGSLDVSDIAAEAMPAVVSITSKSVQEVQSYYSMFGYGGYAPQTEEREVKGSGSGIIVGKNDKELLIATNFHVVDGAQTLSVGFADNSAYEAKIKGYEQNKDLAVVSVALEDISDETMDAISIAKVGSSDEIAVGEQVVAIGNALGYGQSVTTGIVSAKNRKMNAGSGAFSTDENDNRNGVNLIQTDAAINPGNSGGALLNMRGEVVGINSAKLASTDVEGMGYAIAISDVSDVLENLMNEKARERLDDEDHGVLGIIGRAVSEEAIQVYGIPEGVFVIEVTDGGPADEAGIKENYVITKFDGKSVTGITQLVDRLQYYEAGEEVEVTMMVQNAGGYEERNVMVTLGKNTNADKEDDQDDEEERVGLNDGQDEENEEYSDEDLYEEGEEIPDEDDQGAENFFKDWAEGKFFDSSMKSFGGWR